MTPSARLKALHESRSTYLGTIEPMRSQTNDALQGSLKDLLAIASITAFVVSIIVWSFV